MAKWFKLNRWLRNGKWIEPVEVTKETEQQVVWLDEYIGHSPTERRSYKAGEYFPTFAEAKAYKIKELEREIGMAKAKLQSLRSELGQIESLAGEVMEGK